MSAKYELIEGEDGKTLLNLVTGEAKVVDDDFELEDLDDLDDDDDDDDLDDSDDDITDDDVGNVEDSDDDDDDDGGGVVSIDDSDDTTMANHRHCQRLPQQRRRQCHKRCRQQE